MITAKEARFKTQRKIKNKINKKTSKTVVKLERKIKRLISKEKYELLIDGWLDFEVEQELKNNEYDVSKYSLPTGLFCVISWK